MMPRLLMAAFVLVGFGVFACDDGGGSGGEATSEPSATQIVATTSPTPSGPTPTPEGFTNARQALDAYITQQLGEENAGACSTTMSPGQQPGGICSTLLYESAELTTYVLGVPFSEGIGELVLTRDAAGQVWNVTFVAAPVLGEQIAVGATAVVFGAGDCLNFRESPSPTAMSLTCQLDGTTGEVVEGPVMAGGLTWWRLQGLGWGSSEFLGVAAE